MSIDEAIHISSELGEIINGAFERKRPIVVAYVAADGQPHLSFRGSTQVHADDQLAIWVREAHGGLLGALPGNPRMTLMYRDSDTRTTFLFYGRAHVVTDATVGRTIYDRTPKGERDKDPNMAGVPIVIDLDAVTGGVGDTKVSMRRQ